MSNNLNDSPVFNLKRLALPSLLLGSVALLPAMAQSQSAIYFENGFQAGTFLGGAINGAGDCNGDGYPDMVVGSRDWGADTIGPDGTAGTGDELLGNGIVVVYSGADGTVLWTRTGDRGGVIGPFGGTFFGDGDAMGTAVDGAGDANGDGFADVLNGADGWMIDPDGTPGTGDEASGGRLYIHSGKDGTDIHTFDGDPTSFAFTTRDVTGLGDVDADGYDDCTAAIPFFGVDPDGTPGTGDELGAVGRAYVISGKTGTAIYTLTGATAAARMGWAQAAMGDVNLDGNNDFAMGNYGETLDPDGTPGNGDDLAFAGKVRCFSGKTGTELWAADGSQDAAFFGRCTEGGDDLDLNGFPDIVVGESGYDLDPDGTPATGDEVTGVGHIHALNGSTGATMWTIEGLPMSFTGEVGQVAVLVGDFDTDGFPDALAGARHDSDPDGTPGSGDELLGVGRVSVLSGTTGATLATFEGANQGDGMGSVGFLGDVNGDGAPDIALGVGGWDDVTDPNYGPGPDGTFGTGFDDTGSDHGQAIMMSTVSLPLTADTHLMSVTVANSQTMTIDAGVGNATKNYWLFTGFGASGDTPGVTMAPGVVIPLNQPDPLTSFVISLTQLGGGAPTFVAWKGTLGGTGTATPSINTFGPVPVAVGVNLHHAALVYDADACGVGCDLMILATNFVNMTTTP